ncbi:phage/plasmid replication domain-containing protein [Roseivirga pacifica]|uniref:phage/plasmid replication domain-containing protein n=1 Tax=Roseivirga pacifica TaxID=1267423 RepID=UPI003BA85EE4
MLDTVVLRIHDLEYHERLAEWLNNKHNKRGVSYYDKMDIDEMSVEKKRLHKTMIVYHDTGNMIEKTHTNYLKSSHYNLAYRIVYIHDYIEFNFSIPKYVFGTNIIHYNTSPNSKKFQFYKHSTIEHNLAEMYDRFIRFIKKFFTTEFGEIPINLALVELNRLDICYNQMFQTKHDALAYMKELRNVRKKWSRDTTNALTWETSMMHKVNGRYSIKCYHKGSEFKKNDYQKLKDKPQFDVEYYQKFADRILRYEFTIFNGYLSYLYQLNNFRKQCPLWAEAKELARKNEKDSTTKKYREWRSKLTPFDKRKIAYYNFVNAKRRKFMLSDGIIEKWPNKFRLVDEENELYTIEQDVTYFDSRKYTHNTYCLLTKDFFKTLSNKFLDLVYEFKLDVAKDRTEIFLEIDRYNDQIKAQKKKFKDLGLSITKFYNSKDFRIINKSRILPIIHMLETMSWAEIERSGMYSRKTLYNYKKDLEKLGVTEKTTLSKAINAPFDMKAYTTELFENTAKFKNLEF